MAVRHGESADIFGTLEPYTEVFFDSGALRAVMEVVDARAKRAQWEAQSERIAPPPSTKALLRASEAVHRAFDFATGNGNGDESPARGDEKGATTAPRPDGATAQPTKTIARTRKAPAKAPATAADADLSSRATKVLRALTKLGDWSSRGDVLTATKLAETDWLPAVKELLDAGLVKQKGLKKGARYITK